MKVLDDDTSREAARTAMCDQLEAEAAQWVGIVNAATAQLVQVIARALQTGAWSGWGINTPEHWVGLRFGVSSSRAKRLVSAAEALIRLPAVSAAFEAGELTEDHVAVIANAAPAPGEDARVVDLARSATVSQLRYALRGVPTTKSAAQHESASSDRQASDGRAPDGRAPSGEQTAEPAADPVRERPASATSWFDDTGGWWLRANGDATDGALIDKALRAAGDRLFHERYGDDADVSLRQQITSFDSFVYLCKVGLDALDPATRMTPGRTPSERFVVNVHLDPANPNTAALHLGPLLPPHLRHEATCDALRRLWLDDGAGNVNLGRAARVVDAKLRTVLEHRDHACRYPGCGRTRGLIAHHVVHWEHGGPTDVSNLLLLCAEHHREVHRGRFRIVGDPNGKLIFVGSDGRVLGPLPPDPPRLPIAQAAAAAGLDGTAWRNRLGEPGQWNLVVWSDVGATATGDGSPRTPTGLDDDDLWPDPWPDPLGYSAWSQHA